MSRAVRFRRGLAVGLVAVAALGSVALALDSELKKAAGDPDASVRADAARRLARDGSPAAARLLAELLCDRSPAARDAAVLASGRLVDPKAIACVTKLARSADANERRVVAEVLGALPGGVGTDVLVDLARKDRDVGVRLEAVDALVACGDRPEARDALREALASDDADLRGAAVCALAALGGDDGAACVADALGSDDAALRAAAWTMLCGESSPSIESRLPSAVDDPAWQVRVRAVEAAATLRSAPCVSSLVALLGDPNLRVADAAHRALRALSGKDFGRDGDVWTGWWTAAKPTWTPPAGDLDVSHAAADPRLTRAAYHGVPVQSDALVFLIDASGSMGLAVGDAPSRAAETRWDLAGAELGTTLSKLPDGTRVNVLTFQGEVRAAFDAPQPLDDRSRQRLAQFLKRTSPRESGDLVAALEAALRQPGVDTVFLLTDGDPSAGRAVSPGRVRAAVRQLNRTRAIAVHTIGFGAGKMAPRALLSGLARDSGGVCVFRED